ncbi:leucyl aminopeptidase [Mesocricetibacter intestinalis]|uniref:leucyl aminopeptidase n=1 Tax=Mesocricetibacter intestinalis TaxID=1521930 RepID=UPI0010615337|nr:leucyl aminopeptidase [Mesocricetibacter intestinalis]
MKYSIKNTALDADHIQAVILAIFEGGKLSPAAESADKQLQGEISKLIRLGDLRGNFGQTLLLHKGERRIILVGCGKAEEINERRYKQLCRKVVPLLKEIAADSVLNELTEVALPGRDLYWNIRFAIETTEQAFYAFHRFKTRQKDEAKAPKEMIFSVADKEANSAQQAILHGTAIASGIKQARDIANCPPNLCNPAYLAEQALALAEREARIHTRILGEQEMAELKMNAYLAVSRGSANEAKLSVIEYKNHPDPQAQPIVLIGKGLTFDAGGISLKPATDMDEMKYDMCGAAAVFGVMNAIAALNLPLNVIGMLAGCENLPDGNAYRPGDILTTMKGLTVEVLNTDAEGRLVLCDTLTYAESFNPRAVIDIATLTGACVVALGQHNSGLLSDNDQLAHAIENAAQQADDKAWRLPLSEEYQEQLKSNFADLANIGGRWGGAITAAAFLSNFSGAYPWAHLDIAGTAWLQGAEKGATGRPVSLLVQYLINLSEQ